MYLHLQQVDKDRTAFPVNQQELEKRVEADMEKFQEKYHTMDESVALEELKRLNFNTADLIVKSGVDYHGV